MTRVAHILLHGDRCQFAEDWTGLRYRYGYKNRPFAMAHQPRGFIIGSVDEASRIPAPCARWGIIEYPFQLEAREVAAFELVDMGRVDTSS